LGEITAVEPPDSKAFSLRRTPETLAAHRGVERVQRAAFSAGGLRRQRERGRERGEREQRDVALTEVTRAGGEAPEKEAPPERDSRKQPLRRGRKGLGLASTLASNPRPDGPKPGRFMGQWSFTNEIELQESRESAAHQDMSQDWGTYQRQRNLYC